MNSHNESIVFPTYKKVVMLGRMWVDCWDFDWVGLMVVRWVVLKVGLMAGSSVAQLE